MFVGSETDTANSAAPDYFGAFQDPRGMHFCLGLKVGQIADLGVGFESQSPINTGPTRFTNVVLSTSTFMAPRYHDPRLPIEPGPIERDAPAPYTPRPVSYTEQTRGQSNVQNTSNLGQRNPYLTSHQAPSELVERREGSQSMRSAYTGEPRRHPSSQDPRFGYPPTTKSRHRSSLPTIHGPHRPHARVDTGRTTDRYDSNRLRMAPNPDHPQAQMIPLDPSGHRIRPTSSRLPPMRPIINADLDDVPTGGAIAVFREHVQRPPNYRRSDYGSRMGLDLPFNAVEDLPERRSTLPSGSYGTAFGSNRTRTQGRRSQETGHTGGYPVGPSDPGNVAGHTRTVQYGIVPRRRPRQEYMPREDPEDDGPDDEGKERPNEPPVRILTETFAEVDRLLAGRQQNTTSAHKRPRTGEGNSNPPATSRNTGDSDSSTHAHDNEGQAEPGAGKSRKEKPKGHVRHEGYNNLQVLDPRSNEWRESPSPNYTIVRPADSECYR